MAASDHLQLFIFSLLIFISLSKAQKSPKALLLPVSKDPSTLQYLTHLNLGTPLNPKTLLLDLGGRNLWMDCDSDYKSSTYQPPRCGSAACSTSMPILGCLLCFDAGCHNNTCLIPLENTITITVGFFEVATDVLSIQSSLFPNFIFGCSQTWLLKGLATGVKGQAGLGRTRMGLPHQLSSKFGLKFALCLPTTAKSNGILVFGNPPTYTFYPDYNKSKFIDVSKSFAFTKLFVNPVSTADNLPKNEPSAEYFVAVTSILINRKAIRVNQTLLSIDKKGYGGTKISTVNPYTILESSIYKVVAERFAMELEAMNVSKVGPVAPFSECFSTEFLAQTLVGPGVPDIALVFQNKDLYWEFQGANLVVEINHDVVCLAFVDGGFNPRTSIVIGGHQLEDNLLLFDLASSKLGFTSLLSQEIECANFHF